MMYIRYMVLLYQTKLMRYRIHYLDTISIQAKQLNVKKNVKRDKQAYLSFNRLANWPRSALPLAPCHVK